MMHQSSNTVIPTWRTLPLPSKLPRPEVGQMQLADFAESTKLQPAKGHRERGCKARGDHETTQGLLVRVTKSLFNFIAGTTDIPPGRS
jgi:hypothetical protein